MQISPLTSTAFSTPLSGSLASVAQITFQGRAQAVVVEHTSGGYEAYVANQSGPVATGSSIEMAESRLSAAVSFEA